MKEMGTRTRNLQVGDRVRPMNGHSNPPWGQVLARDEARKTIQVRLEEDGRHVEWHWGPQAKGHVWVVQELAE